MSRVAWPRWSPRAALLVVAAWAIPGCLVGDGFIDVEGDARAAGGAAGSGGAAGGGTAGAAGTGGSTATGGAGGATGGTGGATGGTGGATGGTGGATGGTGGATGGTGGAPCAAPTCAGQCCVDTTTCGYVTETGCQAQPQAACDLTCFSAGRCCLEGAGGCGVRTPQATCVPDPGGDGGSCDLTACQQQWGAAAEVCCTTTGSCGRQLGSGCTDAPCTASLCFGACCAGQVCGWVDAAGMCSTAPGGLPGDALDCDLDACPYVLDVQRCCVDSSTCGYRYGNTCRPAPAMCTPGPCSQVGFDCCVTAAGPCGYTQGNGSCGRTPFSCSGQPCIAGDGCCPAQCGPANDPDCGGGGCGGAAPNDCGGTCVDLQTDEAHCGTCISSCVGAQQCVGGVCQSGSCPAGYADCDANPTTACQYLATDLSHCGTCGNVCSSNNTAAIQCVSGTCTPACLPGWGNCDGIGSNGCETSLSSGPNCGSCGYQCPSAGGVSTCIAGACAGITCYSGLGNCDGSAANGCETSLDTVSNCGACGAACSTINAAPTCSGGACTLSCAAGWGDCDGNAANGCEVDLRSTAAHCGQCGVVCSMAGAAATMCGNGTCAPACLPGWGDCDGSGASGCETSLTAQGNCGACGVTCPPGTNASPRCAGSACALDCDPGWGDCDGAAGCETNVQASAQHCGACGNACPAGAPTCNGGGCTACPAGTGNCDGLSVNGCEVALTTVQNCGGCGVVCSSSNGLPACIGSTCSITCGAGWGDCDGSRANGCETPTSSSVTHCGACLAGCTVPNASPACVGGVCAIGACNPGWGDCDGNVLNGCEASLATSTAHCGACGAACSSDNGVATCTSGACGIACDFGWDDCDGNLANGCEAMLGLLPHCGACGNACSSNHGTPGCTSMACTITCDAGWGNCDADLANGCEADMGSVQTCGVCAPCSSNHGTPTCTAGACGITCSSGWANCDGNAANGCETDVFTSTTHCGACGATCAGDDCRDVAGCVAGACTFSPRADGGSCSGVAPPPTCADAVTVRTYAASGSCAAGACAYTVTDTACPYGCRDGACFPTLYGELDVWLDPTETASMTFSSGSTVAAMDDLSLNGHVFGTLSTREPTLVADHFGPGLPGLYFAGDDNLKADVTLGAHLTVFMVVDTLGGAVYLLNHNNDTTYLNTGNPGLQLYGDDARWAVSRGGAMQLQPGPVALSGGPRLLTFTYGALEQALYVGGTLSPGPLTGSLLPDTGLLADLTLASASYEDRFLVGHLGEVRIYRRQLTAVERSAVWAELSARWGVPL